VAGKKSHGYAQHEHGAGCLLLARMLNEHAPGVEAVVHRDGWPDDASAFEGAKAIVYFADGGDRGPILGHLDAVAGLMKRGVGLGVMHYALDVPKGEPGDRFLNWIGGHYERDWSVNPMWRANFDKLPEHQVTRGVKPFTIRDEWYYHMRFRAAMDKVTPVLTAVPPDDTREREFGPHSGNPTVRSRKGQSEHTMWVYERPGGGRGFGFSGGHYHWAFRHDDYRKLLLNAILWMAGAEVPAAGVRTPTPTWDELRQNLESEPPEGFTEQDAMKTVEIPAGG
jgi:type 1 glutamine amidotransferase